MSFSLIRTYAGGYHCQKAINCYLVSSSIVVLVLAIVRFTPKEYMLIISLVLLFFSIPIFLKFAPMGTPTKPLDVNEWKHYRKKALVYLSIEFVVFTVLLLIQLYNFAFIVCLGIMVSAGLVFLQKYLFQL